MKVINKAVIPAAGLGKRMQPLSSYISKPMLPLGKKPVLHHIVDEIRAAGITEILIRARSEHQSLRDYFKEDSDITIETDDSAGGPGEAVLAGKEFVGDHPFLVVFSDAPLSGKKSEKVIREMVEIFQCHSPECLMSIYPIPKEETVSRGVVSIAEKKEERLFQIESIMEKPDIVNTSQPKASACRYLFTSKLFDALRKAERDQEGELQVTAGVNQLLAAGRDVLGISLPEGIERHDTGNFEGYNSAVQTYLMNETF